MPELPEVETTLRGIKPYLNESIITNLIVRNNSMRWPVPTDKLAQLVGQKITFVERRAKYLLLHTPLGSILLHLGMSGSISVKSKNELAGKHDHIDIVVTNPKTKKTHVIRLNDPRRFGCCLVLYKPIFEHKLLINLGPEPLEEEFNGDLLFDKSRGRSLAIKNFIMDGKVVVGVGNIYASESLFLAGIRPSVAAKKISRKRYHVLAEVIKGVLSNAIKAGGTTLNDFTQVDGKPGYFQQELNVYGRKGEACNECGSPIKMQIIGQRSTFYCIKCQNF